MRTGLPKQKKITDIWFDEKDPLIHIRTPVSYTHLDVYKRQVLGLVGRLLRLEVYQAARRCV